MSKVLVTGGAGFIGSHVVEKLPSKGYNVVVIDDLSKGVSKNLSKVGHLVKVVEADVRDEHIVKGVLKGVDYVIHLAALVSVEESIEKPSLYHEVNAIGTFNLLQCSAKAGVKRFTFVSSCAVYGDPKSLPIKETDAVNPLSPYAESKLVAEEYCRAFSGQFKLGAAVLRLFNVYGPRQANSEYSGVITKFLERLRLRQPPVIYGDGEQTRDFIFVEDVVEYAVRALETVPNMTVNIGSGKATTINELARLVQQIAGTLDMKSVHLQPKKGEIRHSLADISLSRVVLGQIPVTSLEEGLGKTISSME